MNQRPVAVGLLLCEQLIVEEATRNITPVNCFSYRKVDRVPAESVPFIVFALLTDGLGEIPLEVVISRLDDLEDIYQAGIMARFTDPLKHVRCKLPIRDCTFPVEGYYQVSLLADDEPIARRKLQITLKDYVS